LDPLLQDIRLKYQQLMMMRLVTTILIIVLLFEVVEPQCLGTIIYNLMVLMIVYE